MWVEKERFYCQVAFVDKVWLLICPVDLCASLVNAFFSCLSPPCPPQWSSMVLLFSNNVKWIRKCRWLRLSSSWAAVAPAIMQELVCPKKKTQSLRDLLRICCCSGATSGSNLTKALIWWKLRDCCRDVLHPHTRVTACTLPSKFTSFNSCNANPTSSCQQGCTGKDESQIGQDSMPFIFFLKRHTNQGKNWWVRA